MKKLIFFLVIFLSLQLQAQQKVLVFTKTNGFKHGSIGAGVTMITELGNSNKLWNTTQTNDANDFTATNLAKYKAVIWCNTSGDNLLNDSQKKAFENFIKNGGGFVGIHAATDTYRDGSWPFYNKLVGGIVQTGPNHTSNNFNATMTVLKSHPTVDFLGKTWKKGEEYYYWKNNGGYLFPGNINLLRVESTGTKDYDEARPISWYKEFEGGRSFYTALGHNDSDYKSNTNFRKHVEEGIKYAIGGKTLSSPDVDNFSNKFKISQNPVQNTLIINFIDKTKVSKVSIYSLKGNLISKKEIIDTATSIEFDVEDLASGVYFVTLENASQKSNLKFIKK
jgi:uncharacterized protein